MNITTLNDLSFFESLGNDAKVNTVGNFDVLLAVYIYISFGKANLVVRFIKLSV